MGREEFTANDGQNKWATKIRFIRSVDGLKNATVPEDKPLSNNTGSTNYMPPTAPMPTDADAPHFW